MNEVYIEYNNRISNKKVAFKKLITIWGALTLFFASTSFAFVVPIPFIILIGLLLVAADVVTTNRFLYRISLKPLLPFALFVILYFVSLSWTLAPNYGLFKASVVLCWIIYFALISGYIKNNLSLFLKANIILSILYIALIFIFFGGPISTLKDAFLGSHRLGGLNYNGKAEFNPIWLSRYIGFLILSLFLFNYKKKTLFWYWIFYVLAVLYLIASGSKGPIVALLFCILFFLFKTNFKKFFRWIIVILMILLCIIPFIDITNGGFVASRFSFESSSVNSRSKIIYESVKSNREFSTILLGKGTGSLGFILEGEDTRYYPHNITIEVLVENGIFGLFSLLLAFLLAWVKGLKNQVIIPLLFFLFFFLNAQFSGDLMFNQFIFMFYFILISEKRKIYKYV